MDSFANCAVVIVRDAAVEVLLDHRHLLNHVANNDVDCVAVAAAAMGNKTVDGDDQDEAGQAVEDHTETTEDNDDVRNMMEEEEEGVSKKKEKNGHCHMEEGQDE